MNDLRNNRRKVMNSFRVKPVPGSRSVQRSEKGGRAGKKQACIFTNTTVFSPRTSPTSTEPFLVSKWQMLRWLNTVYSLGGYLRLVADIKLNFFNIFITLTSRFLYFFRSRQSCTRSETIASAKSLRTRNLMSGKRCSATLKSQNVPCRRVSRACFVFLCLCVREGNHLTWLT